MRLGPVEIGLILVIVLIVFGAGKLPQVGSALGKSIREFKKASRGDDEESGNDPKTQNQSLQDKSDKS
ncbi:MAG TPA: twin-arginine translocase TatA/TatE family subunit [Dehalococcoidales bacterium]|jgi:sec-independent protein translocase protein TatA